MGFWKTLQPWPDPKLTIPWTSQEPSGFWQLRGPPVSLRVSTHCWWAVYVQTLRWYGYQLSLSHAWILLLHHFKVNVHSNLPRTFFIVPDGNLTDDIRDHCNWQFSYCCILGWPLDELTLYPAVMPSPPAQTILSVARMLHQSGCEQVSWPTTGSQPQDVRQRSAGYGEDTRNKNLLWGRVTRWDKWGAVAEWVQGRELEGGI